MCVTSPPYYGLRDYGNENDQIGLEESPEEFIEQLVEVFRGVRDCLTDDGTLWVNIGDSYYNYRGGKGQALPKQSVAKTNQDLPQAKNPRRGNKLKGYKEKDLIGIPWMLAFALRKDGWYLRQDIVWSKPNPMPESVRDRCTKSHEYIFLLSKNQNYYFDVESIKEPTVDNKSMKRKKSVWEVKTKPYKGAHFAVYPYDLIVPTILAGSEESDIILDPFMGSGTTAAVAKSLDRHYLGCELHADYDDLIQKRVREVTNNKISESPLDQLM
ncbi:MAG: DNA adenine methylase [Rhodopirellula sp.]|nr:DNA adenine methylase [Rhodopirellula sp.]